MWLSELGLRKLSRKTAPVQKDGRLHLRVIRRGFVVSQSDAIRQLIKLFHPEGVELRWPWDLIQLNVSTLFSTFHFLYQHLDFLFSSSRAWT